MGRVAICGAAPYLILPGIPEPMGARLEVNIKMSFVRLAFSVLGDCGCLDTMKL